MEELEAARRPEHNKIDRNTKKRDGRRGGMSKAVQQLMMKTRFRVLKYLIFRM